MYSLVAQLVEHLKLNQEVPGSFPGWGIMIFSLHRHQTVRAIYCHSDNLSHSVFFVVEKCFLVLFFPQNVGFFFLYHAGESQVLQIFIYNFWIS